MKRNSIDEKEPHKNTKRTSDFFFENFKFESKRNSQISEAHRNSIFDFNRASSIRGRGSNISNHGANHTFCDLIKDESVCFENQSQLSFNKELNFEIKRPLLVSSLNKNEKTQKPKISIKEFQTTDPAFSDKNATENQLVPIRKSSTRKKKDEKNKKTCCTCSKTKCLKLYCECFAARGFCSEKCKCKDCHNKLELKDLRDLIIQETLEKNPLAFNSKYKKTEDIKQVKLHSRGCNCKKTGCVKNYCECYTAGIGCSKICKCENCLNEKMILNDEEAGLYKEKILRKRKKPNYLYEFYFEKYNNLKKVKENESGEK